MKRVERGECEIEGERVREWERVIETSKETPDCDQAAETSSSISKP